MSKESAMAALTGVANPVVNHSIITGELPKNGAVPNPALDLEAPVQNQAVKTVLDSDAAAIMARKEAKFVRERNEWNKKRETEQAEIEDLKKKLKDPYDKIQAFEAKRKENPIEALKEIGFSETEIFNFLSSQEKKEPTTDEIARTAAQEELAKFKEEQAKLTSDAQKSRDETVISKFKSSIKESISAGKDKYEYLAFNGPLAEELVYDTVNEILKDTGELIDLKEALELVENYYEEQDKAMAQIKKRQVSSQSPGQAPSDVKKEPERTRTITPPPQPNPPAKTLTNKLSPSSSSMVKRQETSEQKKARLIDALKRGKL